MNKSRKYVLIASGVAVLVIAGSLIYSGYISGRMPTLPTPTDVVVPPGLRYVGGDEFDGPDGATPPVFERRKEPEGTSPPICTLQAGALHLVPTWSETSIRGYAGVVYPIQLDFRKPVRIEIRAKIHVPERTKSFAKTNKTGGIQQIAGAILIGEKFRPMRPGGIYTEVFYYAYSGDGVGVYERTGRQNLTTLDDQFHTFSMEWHDGNVAWSRDGVLGKDGWDYRESVISDAWMKRLSLLPESAQDFLRSWKASPADTLFNLSLGDGDFIRPAAPNDLATIDIDYVRIFQE